MFNWQLSLSKENDTQEMKNLGLGLGLDLVKIIQIGRGIINL